MAALILLVGVLAVGGPAQAAGRATDRTTLLISVAISLEPALGEWAREFESDHPGVRVRLNAGGSGVLAQQIRRGAPADLLISASPVEIDRLAGEQRVLTESRQRVAGNALVLVLPPEAPVPQRLAELTDPRFDRIVIGNPRTAPVGRYARQALRALGLWEPLRSRVIPAENARQALEYVARGEVAAGLVYRTDAELVPGRVAIGPGIPPTAGVAIVYEAAIVATTEHRELAERFLAGLREPGGRLLLERYGFTIVEP